MIGESYTDPNAINIEVGVIAFLHVLLSASYLHTLFLLIMIGLQVDGLVVTCSISRA